MPSLSNIPDDLLTADAAPRLADWLISQKLPFYHARTYALLWMNYTKSSLSKELWDKLRQQLPAS